MKYLLLSLLSLSAFAQDKAQLEKAFKVLQNPAGAILDSCVVAPPAPEPAWCTSLTGAVCAVPKTGTQTAAVRSALEAQHFHPLSPPAVPPAPAVVPTPLQLANAKIAAVADAETRVAANTGVNSTDMQTLFNETMTSLKAVLQASTIPTPKKAAMMVELNKTVYKTGPQFIQDKIAEAKRMMPSISDEAAKTAALTDYESICEQDGMASNAFNLDTTVIFCPGLIQSSADYAGTSKAKLLTALSYTMAHEIGHSIDAYYFDDVYQNMKTCHDTNTSVPSYTWGAMNTEITADYWGIEVYSKRLAAEAITGQDAVDNIAVAADSYCTIGGDASHPDGLNRIDEYMGRQTQMRTNLSCTTPPSKPACGL